MHCSPGGGWILPSEETENFLHCAHYFHKHRDLLEFLLEASFLLDGKKLAEVFCGNRAVIPVAFGIVGRRVFIHVVNEI